MTTSDDFVHQISGGNQASQAVSWLGDADNEYIFGTSWSDMLEGSVGNDILYGFEGDDTIIGGDG